MDVQSVNTTEGGGNRGLDATKRVTGRKSRRLARLQHGHAGWRLQINGRRRRAFEAAGS